MVREEATNRGFGRVFENERRGSPTVPGGEKGNGPCRDGRSNEEEEGGDRASDKHGG